MLGGRREGERMEGLTDALHVFYFFPFNQHLSWGKQSKPTNQSTTPSPTPSTPIQKLETPGDHVLLSSYDRRVVWFDLDLASTPYRTLKYHTKVRALVPAGLID